LQTADFTGGSDRILLYGDPCIGTKYRSFSITVNKQVYNFNEGKGADIKYDSGGNPIGSVYDLGANGAFTDVKLIIGKFYNQGFTKASFEDHVGKALNEKGFQWYCTEDEDDFLLKLPTYNVAWVIGFTYLVRMKNSNFPDKVIAFHKSNKGLMLWEDNDAKPGGHTTETLQKLFRMSLQGNDPGTQIMRAAADCSQKLTFSRSHPIATGLNNLYEGFTICYPTSTPQPLKILATSSSGRPNIMYVEEGKNKSSGRVVIDCGFTKLFEQCWTTTGTARYVVNATCWLSGFLDDPNV